MKTSFFAWLALLFGLVAVTCRAADINPEIVPLGNDTYALTHWATNGFTLNTDKISVVYTPAYQTLADYLKLWNDKFELAKKPVNKGVWARWAKPSQRWQRSC